MADRSFDVFMDALQTFKVEGKPVVVATLVHCMGSAPQNVGARAIVSETGLEFGTVGGGKIEAKVIVTAQELLANRSQKTAFFQWNLQKDIGMTCGGVASFFLEVFRSETIWKIAVFGAGHVAQELVRLLIKLDCELICSDPRAHWIGKLPEHPRLQKVCTPEMAKLLPSLDSQTFVVIMTMGHATDLPILSQALSQYSFPYVGNMGSEIKAKVLRKDLTQAGVSLGAIDKLYCPIGESFGNNSPIEIAFSVVAQLLKVRDQHFLGIKMKHEVDPVGIGI